MCLTLSKNRAWGKPLIAKKDIVCYKVVKSRANSSALMTEYRGEYIYIGGTYTSGFSFDFCGGVEKGLHSFKKKSSVITSYHSTSVFDRHLVECIIPAGSKYYVGDFIGKYDSYASDTLIYSKIIETLK